MEKDINYIIKTINSIQKVESWCISKGNISVFFSEDIFLYNLEIIKYRLSNMQIECKNEKTIKMKWNPSDGPESAEELNEA